MLRLICHRGVMARTDPGTAEPKAPNLAWFAQALLLNPRVWLAMGFLLFLMGALQLPLGDSRDPGPGFLPAAMAALGLSVLLVDLLRGEAVPGAVQWAQKGSFSESVRAASRGLYLFAYIALLPVAGYHVATFLLVLVVSLSMDRRGWVRGISLGSGVVFGTWLLLEKFLGVPLP